MQTAVELHPGNVRSSKFGPLLLLVLLAVFLPCAAWAQQPQEERWSAEARYAHSLHVSGTTRVREFQIRGDRLDLNEDLGVEQWNIYEAEIGRRLDSGDRIRFSYFYSRFSGSEHRGAPFDYNGASFLGGQDVNIEQSTYQRLAFLYEYTVSPRGSSSELYWLIGLYTDLLNVKIDAELDPDTESQEKGEDFGLQVLVWPTLGIGGRTRATDALELWGEAFGWHIQGTDIPYREGGEFHASQSAFDAVAGFRFVNVLLRPGVAYRYRYFYQVTSTPEDYNKALLRGHFLELSLQARF